MNNSFTNLEDLSNIVELPELEELNLRSNGIIRLNEIDTKFPNLVTLDVSHNKIFSVNNIDFLSNLSNLAELNIDENPINVHKQ